MALSANESFPCDSNQIDLCVEDRITTRELVNVYVWLNEAVGCPYIHGVMRCVDSGKQEGGVGCSSN